MIRFRWWEVFTTALLGLLFVFPRQVLAQEEDIKVGQMVQVSTDGGNLNLRGGPGLNYPVRRNLPNGTVMVVIGGPQDADGYRWWQLDGEPGQGWAAETFLRPIQGAVPQQEDQASESQAVDWRGALSCPTDYQIYEGVLFCLFPDESNPQAYVFVLDLSVSGLRFETILPEGRSAIHPNNDDVCRDPNIPEFGGPEGGCYVGGSPNRYPTMSITTAQSLAQKVQANPSVAGIINADYGGKNDNATHGPEGLLVVGGDRLDGAANCDADFNAALRPWLGLGKEPQESNGLIPAEINRLEKDNSPIPDWLETGIGGGPWLIRDGALLPNLESCMGKKTLQVVEPVTNCFVQANEPKLQVTPPVKEAYASGSCRVAPHTAAGISKDGRWLFFVLTMAQRDPNFIATIMQDQLKVWQAIKFDGGGSTQFYFGAQTPITKDLGGENRRLTNYLAFYAADGDGIQLPLDSKPVEPVYYKVILAGETAKFDLQVENTGSFTWTSEDQVELRLEPWSLLSPAVNSLPLPGRIGPGEISTWEWEINTSGVTINRFQMYQKGEAFGQEFAVMVITLPESVSEKRDEIEKKIQELIDDWKARGEETLDNLIEEIQKSVEAEVRSWCPNFGLLAGLLSLAMIRSQHQRRRRKRKRNVNHSIHSASPTSGTGHKR